MGHFHDWVAYFAGALLALFAKWAWWVKTGRREGKGMWTSTKEWFSLDLTADQVSWAASIVVVWAGGAVYMMKVRIGWDFIDQFPVAIPFAALLGFIMEYVAPAAFKWFLKKLPFGTPSP